MNDSLQDRQVRQRFSLIAAYDSLLTDADVSSLCINGRLHLSHRHTCMTTAHYYIYMWEEINRFDIQRDRSSFYCIVIRVLALKSPTLRVWNGDVNFNSQTSDLTDIRPDGCRF